MNPTLLRIKDWAGLISSVLGIAGAAWGILKFLYAPPEIVRPDPKTPVPIEQTPQRPPPPIASAPPPPPATPSPITVPKLENLFPPEKAVMTMVRAYNPDFSSLNFKAEYSVTNSALGSVDKVRTSLWALKGQHLVQIDSRALGYIGQGDARAANAIHSPILRGKFVFCMSYTYNDQKVERLDFFSDEGQPDLALYHGYPRFRDSIFEINNVRSLCNNMPSAAENFLGPREPAASIEKRGPAPRPGRYCVIVNSREICE